MSVYRVLDIDHHQNLTLAMVKEGQPDVALGTKVPYDQVKPLKSSGLHRVDLQVGLPTEEVPSDDANNEADVDTSLGDNLCEPAQPVPTNDTPVEVDTDNAAALPNVSVSVSEAAETGALPAHSPSSVPPCDSVTVTATVTDPVVTGPPSPVQPTMPSRGSKAVPPTHANPVTSSATSTNRKVRTKRKRDVEDLDSVLFAGRCGPTRRAAEVLPVQPAFQCTTEAELEGLKAVLYRGLELTDSHMDHCSAILKVQFPHVDGLQRMSVFESSGCQRVGTPQGKFVQILLVGCHWVTVSNIESCLDGEVKVYDSVYTKTPKSYRRKFVAQLGWLLHTSVSEITMLWPDVKHQTGNKDCGLFAIANALALCEGVSPEVCNWDQGKMGKHLVSCLGFGKLDMFPVVSAGPRRSKGVVYREVEPVYCNCRQPNDERRFMAECEGCREWFHRTCEEMPAKISATTKFLCHGCK